MTQTRTGYPSIDRPWLKYYSEAAINAPLPECTMYEYIWRNNKDHLSDIALRYYGTKISYGRLFDSIRRAAAAFSAMGVRAGDIVTIMSMHTPETIAAIYGLNYLGAVANMVYMTLAPRELLGTLRNTESKLLLILDAGLEKLNEIKDEVVVPVVVLGVADSMPAPMKLGYRMKAKPPKHDYMTWKGFLEKGGALPEPSADHAVPAVIVYTSGTTGEPKGVVLGSDNLNAVAAQLLWAGRNYKRGENYLHLIPIFVGFGIGMAHLGLSTGIMIILEIAASLTDMGKLFGREKPQRFVGGPSMLDAIMENTKGDLSNIIEFTGGGDAISPEREDEFNAFLKAHNCPTRYYGGYGMTEFGSVAVVNMDRACRRGSVGIPLVGVNMKVQDVESGAELPCGEKGELCICAPNTMLEYYKKPDETAKTIEVDDEGRRWMHTGDLGYVDEDGFVFVVGRLKRVYVTQSVGGDILKIYPQRVEDALGIDMALDNCGVVARPDAGHINVPVAYVTLKSGADAEKVTADLMELARRELPEHMRPAKIHILESMPVTQSGKIDYRALEEMTK